MPGKPLAGDETVLYALPEDQPDSLSKGQKSKQGDLDLTHGMTVNKAEDAVVSNGADGRPTPAKKTSSK